MRRTPKFTWLERLAVAGLVPGCAHGRQGAEPGATDPVPAVSTVRYRVNPAIDRSRLAVSACLPAAIPARLIPGRTSPGVVLVGARAGERALPVGPDGGIELRGLGPGACVDYDLRIDRDAPGAGGHGDVVHTASALVIATGAWLFRPDRIERDFTAEVEFVLPEGVAISTPWPAAAQGNDRRFVIDLTALHWLSHVVIGELSPRRLTRGASAIDLVVAGPGMRASESALSGLIQRSAAGVADLYGRFPVDHVQVIAIPVPLSRTPVLFGRVARGGGPAITLLVGAAAEDSAFTSDWNTIHELIHLGMPFFDDPWLGEGFTSYYTELVLTRVGTRSEVEGWKALEAGFERGRRDRAPGTLRATSAAMHRLRAYHRVYWSGAAIALLIDARLRAASGGRRRLDDALRELLRLRPWPRRTAPADEALRVLDRWAQGSTFGEVAGRWLDETGFPDVTPAYEALGVAFGEGQVTLDPAKADLRTGLMN